MRELKYRVWGMLVLMVGCCCCGVCGLGRRRGFVQRMGLKRWQMLCCAAAGGTWNLEEGFGYRLSVLK